jgi:outer membrane protein
MTVVLLGVTALSANAQSDTLRISLGEAARLAADQNAQVVEARFRVEQARSRVTQQRSALLPQINGQVVQSAHTLNTATFGLEFPAPPGQPPVFDRNGEVIGPVNLSDVRGRVSQTVLDMSVLGRVRATRAAVAAADAQEQAAEQRAGTIAANAYVQSFRAQQLYRSRRTDVALAEELVDIAREQLASGTGVRLDVTRAQAQRATLNAQLVSARNALERTHLALTRALGLPATTRIVLTDTVPVSAGAPDASSAIAIARGKRADLRALEAQIRAAELQVSALRAERLPSMSFVGGDGWIGKSWSHMLHTYDWALQVSVPVFTGFRNRARVEEQEAAVGELQARRHDLEEQLEFEVRSAVLDVSAATELVQAATERLRFAEQEVADARERYESGVSGSADVVTASLRLTEASTAYADALASYETARVALATAEGNVTELP